MSTLKIVNLYASVEGKQILKGINLEIKEGETVALFGPNGHGKSTLLNVIMGHPRYVVDSGNIYFDDIDITNMPTDERAKLGLFLTLQNPVEVPGVINSDFLRAAINAKSDKKVSTYQFYKLLDSAVKEVKMPFDLATRSLNEGFSGGEKKRNEILQLLLLEPKICLLDEIDSGLDVDAIQTIGEVIKKLQNKGRGFFVISHYARLFEIIKPSRAIVIINGRVVLDTDSSVISKIDKEGYEFIKTEYGISIEKEEKSYNQISLGTCAINEKSKENNGK
ncbi:MAG: Fe-S cluster assembly ATPase SufC [Bacilli bacterium]